ncbi:hypothetical protein N6H14_12660 [Paenibacillus sp. CC-CFT747]|nr:hypothetical protein N6H14_12660 [Paenibacillus sp. CC-CFT747]
MTLSSKAKRNSAKWLVLAVSAALLLPVFSAKGVLAKSEDGLEHQSVNSQGVSAYIDVAQFGAARDKTPAENMAALQAAIAFADSQGGEW